MTSPAPQSGLLETELLEAMKEERRDALKFSILTVILTPAFVAIAWFILLLATIQLSSSGSSGGMFFGGSGFVHATTAFLLLACGSFFIPQPGHPGKTAGDYLWLALGVGVLGVLALLTYATLLRQTHPGLFWGIYGIFSIGILGLVGRGYIPGDEDYVRFEDWGLDDQALDRADREVGFWVGWAVAFPRLILGSYGELLGGLWLWQDLDPSSLRVAVDLLRSMGARDFPAVDTRLRSAPDAVSGRALRWLLRLELIRRTREGLRLTSDGELFVARSLLPGA
jgi:hypothetical protein